ncbi:collagen alpha-1(VI) chain-like [Hyla sarda]|uniref:collagen alpha-1(VI) chain-like n=1 Tax=Hyla sarda TaxID=327740 RepID=UPI0024C35E12|nr:collagen alpha-1(VI) chain-like [Hyla sarda]
MYCPVDVFIVLDTSESVALGTPPYGSLVEDVKTFATDLVSQLNSSYQRCDRYLTWNSGALHYSDEVKLISEMVSMKSGMMDLKKAIEDITYLGKGTHTDCAIAAATSHLLTGGSYNKGNKYMIVVTDGYLNDGYKEKCGGLHYVLNEAKSAHIKIFNVMVESDHKGDRLVEIASDPRYSHYLKPNSQSPEGHQATVKHILTKMIEDTQTTCCAFECQALRGSPGPPGIPGDPGSEGRMGPSGKPGTVGTKGSSGDPGPPGQAGVKGAQGLSGAKGSKGQKGPKGVKGRNGVDGKDGAKGEPGLTGLPGCKGEAGPEGMPGSVGQKGDPGPYGATGKKGDQGVVGTEGLPGVTGVTGSKGTQGPMGLKGNKGERGEEGDLGKRGFNGKKGEKGEQGIRGPPGNRGARGEKGKEGPLGPPGHEGITGENGCTGDAGEIGINGFKGEQGLTGTEGEKGSNGFPGSPGEPGAPGNRGEEGEPGQGILGSPGFQGFPGLRGKDGPKGIKGYPGMKGEQGLVGDDGEDNTQSGKEGERGPKGYAGPPGEQGLPGMPGLPGPNECEILDIIQRMSSCCECPCGPVMLLFILDSSESVGLNNFTLQKEFILRVITKITRQTTKMNKEVGANRFGIIQYSHEGKQELLSTDNPNIKTLAQFKSAVKNMQWMAGGTFTGEALDFAKQTVKDSILTHKVAIVMTDGRFDTRDRKSLASLCTVPNMNVVGIGVGDLFKRTPHMKALQEITCQGTKAQGMQLFITEYEDLLDENTLHNITKYTCKNSVCPDFTCQVEFDEPTDIVFLMDGSSSVGYGNFEKVKEFVKITTSKILSEDMNLNQMLKLAVIQYSNAGTQRLEVPFTDNIEDAVSYLSKVTYIDESTDVPYALKYLQNYLSGSGRPNVKNKVIIFSDGRSSGISQNQIAAQAAATINPRTELFAVTVGTFHELGICQLVSGKENNFNFNNIEDRVFRVSEYSDLPRRGFLHNNHCLSFTGFMTRSFDSFGDNKPNSLPS